MKRVFGVFLISLFVLSFMVPAPANAGGNNGWVIGSALLGGFLLGSILGPHDRVIVGPVYPAYPYYSPPPYGYYPPPAYYPPPVYFPSPPAYSLPTYYPPPTTRWIPDHYELRWQTACGYMYQRQNCYQTQITVFVPGHWEY